MEAYLCLFIIKRQDDWVDLLPTAEFVINSQLNSATGHTPFKLLYGYTPDFTIPAGRPTGIPLVDRRLQKMRKMCIDAEAALCLMLRSSLGLLRTDLLPVMTTARIASLVMDSYLVALYHVYDNDSFLGSL